MAYRIEFLYKTKNKLERGRETGRKKHEIEEAHIHVHVSVYKEM